MMGYKELIERLRYIVEHGDEDPAEYCTNHCGRCALCDNAADAIETLLSERDELFGRLRKYCRECVHYLVNASKSPCRECIEGGRDHFFELRGQQKGEPHGE